MLPHDSRSDPCNCGADPARERGRGGLLSREPCFRVSAPGRSFRRQRDDFLKISFFPGEPSADRPGGLPGWHCAAGHHDHFLISLSRLWCNKGFFFLLFFSVFVFSQMRLKIGECEVLDVGV